MANLSFLNGLGAVGSGYYQGVDERMRRQQLQSQMDAQQQQSKGLAALANAYGGMPPPMQQPPPQMPPPPMPGQPSQPQGGPPGGQMQPPPQGQPGMGQPQPRPQPQPQMPPGMMRPGMQGPPQQQMGPPPQQQQPPRQPYTSPQAPQQPPQPPQGMLPPPPQAPQAIQSALPDLETMASTLKKQGVTGMALFAALQQHQSFLSQDGKMQLAAMAQEIKRMHEQGYQEGQDAAMLRANNGTRGEDRRQDTADGDNASGAARIQLMQAQAKAALARANKTASGGGSAAPQDLSALSQWIADGHGDIRSLSTKGGLREKVLNGALKINPDYDQKEYNAENAYGTSGMRTAGTAGAQTAIAAGAAQGGADILMKAASEVPRSDWRSLNKLVLAGKTEANDPKTGAYLTAINTFVNEYARAINPKGTATVSDKEHARELLAATDSQEALEAKIGVMRQEMARGRQAPQDVARDLRANRASGSGAAGAPKVGTVEGGYRFKGGDPANQANWVKQ